MKDRLTFRGRDIETGEWRTGFYNWHEDDSFINVFESKLTELENNYRENVLTAYSVEPKTVGQCTGLKDKDGTLIFEGDKVHVLEISESREKEFDGVVEFNDYMFEVTTGCNNDCYLCCFDENNMCAVFEVEVIGNIYES